MTPVAPTHTYAVYRQNWQGREPYLLRLPGQQRIESFATREAAEFDAQRRDAAIRARVNPFHCGPAFHYLSTFPQGVFADYLRDEGLEPPPTEPLADWATWWTQTERSLTALQRAKLWDGLDKVRFFVAQPINPARIGYAIVAIQWNYNDAWYDTHGDGGALVRVYRRYEVAERERRQLEATQRHQVTQANDFVNFTYRDDSCWPFEGKERSAIFDDTDEAFYELVEVELPEGPTS